jgi:dsDNA-specific endonuclease/ATPase MutS2
MASLESSILQQGERMTEEKEAELRQIIMLVVEMRQAQRKYFRTREGLDESRQLERRVDNAIENLQRPRLFES